MVVKVHGTVFNMKAREKQDHVDVSLLSGLVVVENHGVSRSLNPGETAVCKKSVPSIEKKTTDVSISCLWAKESLRFEKKTIYELTGYPVRNGMAWISVWTRRCRPIKPIPLRSHMNRWRRCFA